MTSTVLHPRDPSPLDDLLTAIDLVSQRPVASDESLRDVQRPVFQNNSAGEGVPTRPVSPDEGIAATFGEENPPPKSQRAVASDESSGGRDGRGRRPSPHGCPACPASDAWPRDEKRPAFAINLAGEGAPARLVSPNEGIATIFGEDKPAPNKKCNRQRLSDDAKVDAGEQLLRRSARRTLYVMSSPTSELHSCVCRRARNRDFSNHRRPEEGRSMGRAPPAQVPWRRMPWRGELWGRMCSRAKIPVKMFTGTRA